MTVLQYSGDIFSTLGEILEYHGGCSVLWEVILSTMEDVQFRGGYHDTCKLISSVPFGMFSTITFFMFSTMGRYHDTCVGDVQCPNIFNHIPPPPPPPNVLNSLGGYDCIAILKL